MLCSIRANLIYFRVDLPFKCCRTSLCFYDSISDECNSFNYRNSLMKWSGEHDVMLRREIIVRIMEI